MEEEFEIEMSLLCQSLSEDGKTVQVDIYRGGGSNWHLEIVDEFGNSTLWDDQFSTDTAALEEAKNAIQTEGINSLIGPPS